MKKYQSLFSDRSTTVRTIMDLATALIFLAFFLFKGAGVYTDSGTYAAMRIDVAGEPIYPLLMAGIRAIFGEPFYYTVIAFLQTLLTIFSTCFFLHFLLQTFDPSLFCRIMVYPVMWAFYLMPGLFSATGVLTFLAMLTEGLVYPMFFIFLVFLLKAVMNLSWRDWFIALMIDSFMILIRTQLIFALMMTLAAMVYLLCKTGVNLRKIGMILGSLLLAYVLIHGVQSLYSKGTTGSFEVVTNKGGLYGNTMYLATMEDEALFEDDFTKELFHERLHDILEWGWGITYYEGRGLIDAAMDVEACHDNIKDHMSMGTYFDENGITDPIEKYKIQNDKAGEIASKLLPAHLGRFLYNYLGLALVGLIRTVATAPSHRIMQIYSLIIYLLLILALIRSRHNHLLFSLLWITVFGAFINAFETALAIMVISRYALYLFPMVYISLLLSFFGGKQILRKKK